MASEKQQGLLRMFEQVSKPVLPQVSLRGPGGASLVPTPQEGTQIRATLNLRERGIGIAPRGTPCSLFEWERMEEATNLASLFMTQSSYDELIRVSVAIRPVVNEEIYVFAMMYACLNRQDTRDIRLPPVEEVLPYWYFPSTVVTEADHRVKDAANEEERIVIPYEFSHNELDPEFRLAYFREDIGVNSHHWHWHLAYPFTWTPALGGSKDRKGELFYYMHQQMMARYDAERLSNGLSRIRPLNDFRQGLDFGYFPNLMSTISGRQYAARPANMTAVDTVEVSLDRLDLWKSRIFEAIHTKSVLDPSGKSIPLEDPRGIEMLGDMLEAAAISINRPYYGDFHNFAHRLVARVHDPDGRFGGERGVMAFSATAMRDPIFYRLHKMVDDIFNEYKISHAPYSRQELEWADIKVSSISVRGDVTKKLNFLQTFWKQQEVLLSRGVDFGRSNPVSVSFNHLDHEEFAYEIEVENVTGKDRQAVVRIFLAPISNELNDPLPFEEQRRMFIELDKYEVTMKPGRQKLGRRSEQSNVTIPSVRGFEQIGLEPGTAPPDPQQGFCGCGWPQHLLIPKGRSEGMRFLLFVMLTNWEQDKVEGISEKVCGDAASYCGIRDQKYPDKRAMGFPFDRRGPTGATLPTFLTANMSTREVVIRHTGEIVDVKGVFQPAPIF